MTLQHGLLLGAALFSVGLAGVLAKRNAIVILMAVEVMLNGVNVTFVAFAGYLQPPVLTGQVFAVFVIAVAAAEAAVGLAIIIAIYRLRQTVQVDKADELRG
ncbi:MAG: NADH-quinone oxidoreductase subunit NuoK [Chloroflexi bacterium]|nr:NADH-quinone oxidoreductase subunit NuoK [Chloroflexota bacterium]